MTKFVQIMEYRTSRIDEVNALAKRMDEERGDKLLARRAITAADRDEPGRYYTIVEFDSYEEAMKNSNDPATTAFSEQMAKLLDGPPKFYNLDVSLQMDR